MPNMELRHFIVAKVFHGISGVTQVSYELCLLFLAATELYANEDVRFL